MRRLICFALLASSACAQTEERPVSAPVPRYEVRRATGKITIDGRLEEAA